MDKYYLLLLPNGDIEIKKQSVYVNSICYETVLHKSYNPGEKLEDNLLSMYEEWEQLNNEEMEMDLKILKEWLENE